MSPSTSIDGYPILRSYYGILVGGADAYGDGHGLLPLLSEDFMFDGPIAGHMAGGTRFTHGVRGFIETVRGMTILQAVVTDAGAAVLYDAELSRGTVRFSEFFEFDGGKIRELRILYPAAEYLASGGR